MTDKIIWNFIHENYLNCSDLREYKYTNGLLIKSTDNSYHVAFSGRTEHRTIMFRISKIYKPSTMWSDDESSDSGVKYEIDNIQRNGSVLNMEYLKYELVPFIREFKLKGLGIND